jgi:phosphonate transport system substrate-binding protein
VAWVSKTSASGYIVPRSSLAKRGIPLSIAFKEDVFLGSHAAVARAVISRQVDVGGTYAVFERGEPGGRVVKAGFLDGTSSPPPVHILDISGPVPSDFVIAASNVTAQTGGIVASALERLAEDREGAAAIQHLMGADRFSRVAPAAMAELRELIRVGKELGAIDR